MIRQLDDYLSPAVTRTTLYRVVRLGLRVYVVALLLAGGYSLLWLAEFAGVVPETLVSAIWIAIAVMGSLFLVLLFPLFYVSQPRDR
ncbi:hypothetical protein [Halopiger thermotolerans]